MTKGGSYKIDKDLLQYLEIQICKAMCGFIAAYSQAEQES